MAMEKFTAFFSKPPKNTYLLIREGAFGIETYINRFILQLNPAYKNQVIHFLKSIIEQLEAVKFEGKDN